MKKRIKAITLTGFNKKNSLQKIGDINIWINSKIYNFIENSHNLFYFQSLTLCQTLKLNEKILVIGGLGYVGTQLVPKLLENNFTVTVYDLGIYGCHLNSCSNLKVIKGDVRDIKKLENIVKNQDIIIHLACISNDPSFELNPKLGRSINFDCFKPLVLCSKKMALRIYFCIFI